MVSLLPIDNMYNIKILQGESLARIYKDNNLDMNIWIAKEVDYND